MVRESEKTMGGNVKSVGLMCEPAATAISKRF